MIPGPAKGFRPYWQTVPWLEWNHPPPLHARDGGSSYLPADLQSQRSVTVPLHPLPNLKISLHIELAPSCTSTVASVLLGRLRTIGFKVESPGGGLLISRKNDFRTLGAARRAVGEIVNEVGATVLDSRVEMLLPRRRRRRQMRPRRGDSKAA